jgi:hypothetical protein
MPHLVRVSTSATFPDLYINLIGVVETSAKIAAFGRTTLNLVSKCEGITNEAFESIKIVEIGGDVLPAIGVLFDKGRFFHEVYNGPQPRVEIEK